MKKRNIILALILSSFFGFSAYPASAQNQPASGDSLKAAAPAEDAEKEFEPKMKDKDPFKTLVAPPPAVKEEGHSDTGIKQPEPPKPPEPLPLKVTFIVGTDIRRFAVISLNNKYYEMVNGDEAEGGLFRVVEVTDRGVKVWDSKVQKERVLELKY